MKLTRTHILDPDFLRLVALLDNDLRERYQQEQDKFAVHNHLADGNVVLASVNNQFVACGCFRQLDNDTNTAEIKRMYTMPEYRGRGIAKAIVTELERWAKEKGYPRIVLETADRQPEAQAVYRGLGYKQIENYGPYKNISISVCLEKKLS